MTSSKLFALFGTLALVVIVAIAGCGGGGGDGDNGSRSLVSITITPANGTLQSGSTLNFTATGTYSDNSSANLTQSANWSSTVPSVATAGNAAGAKGVVSGVAAGSTQIIAMVGSVSGSAPLTVTGNAAAETNVMAVTVNGALCSAGSYLNKPCVSVTICNPGGTTCRTVTDILLDTGSYGLRVFKQAIPGLTLTQAVSGTDSLAECVNFADGSSLWGPVQIAELRLGNQQVPQIPIQVVDASFGSRPGACAGSDATPQEAGYNGVLGIGVLPEDCGPACAGPDPVGNYFRCNGTGCSGSSVPLENQVQNPVARLPVDNNGVLIRLPSVPLGGLRSLDGTLVFGIGTKSNNTPGTPTVFRTDDNGNIRTTYKGLFTTAYVDTGSNGIFFPNASPTIAVCPQPNSDWYCPSQTTTLSAALMDASRELSRTESFEIGNLVRLATAENRVLREAGGPANFIFGVFDWGLPFFMGRNVYFGISGAQSTLGTGPYIAY